MLSRKFESIRMMKFSYLKILHLCPILVVTFTLKSNLATDCIEKKRGEPGLFSLEYNHVAKIDIKVKVTTYMDRVNEYL